MKKCLSALLVSLCVIGLSSCSEDFEVAAPYKDVTVVYGLLNAGDTAQYIRIQKAFLDEHKSALEMAGIADSSFYRDLDVRLKEVRSNGTVTAGTPLNRVDLNQEGFPKAPGTFFTAPSWAYKYKGTLNPASRYRLVITNTATGNVDSAETGIIDTAGGTTFNVQPLFISRFALDYSANSTNVRNTQTVSVPSGSPAAYFEGYIKFNYVNEQNGVQKDTFFIWNFAQNTPVDNGGNKSAALTTGTDVFFRVVKANVPPAADGQSRYLDSADVYVWAADQNYYNYAIANQVTGGITADQVRPVYTTIRGKNVVGMLGSRAVRIKYDVPFNEATLDTLRRSTILKDLRFVGRSDH